MKPGNVLENIYNAFEDRHDKIWEVLTFLLYLAGIIFVAYFHEPWFDEFQALQIAKTSVYNILFVIPHMEGHPPLWYLILKFTYLFTDNPEWCIKIPNVIFASMAVWLLIFKSPFSRIVRLSLPFTYFIFYQYGVISRPYSIFMFALFLVACLYIRKNEKPFAFGSSLGLLCLSSCYGIIISFAITLVWLIEIWNKQKIIPFAKAFVKDKRFYSMLLLFLLCVLIFFEIYPVFNDIAKSAFSACPIYQKILYFLFGFIADSTIFNICNYESLFALDTIDLYSIIAVCLGAYITYILFKYFSKNNFLLFSLTYLFYLFICFKYFYPHHVGILTLILIFNFWCSYFKDNKIQKINLGKPLVILIGITLIVQIYWSITSGILEIKHDYSYGRAVAQYIKNNDIAHKYKIFTFWGSNSKLFDENGNEIKTMKEIIDENKQIKQVVTDNTYSNQPFAIPINAYFNKNIFYNFNVFTPEYDFTMHADARDLSSKELYNAWRSFGIPDIMFLNLEYVLFNTRREIFPQLKQIKTPWEEVYSGLNLSENYIPIKEFPNGFIWKGNYYSEILYLYIKKSLYKTSKDWK